MGASKSASFWARYRWRLLLGALVLVVLAVLAWRLGWFGPGSEAPVETGGPPVVTLGPALARYKFRGMWRMNEDAYASALSHEECNVECDSHGCSNCVCPDVCARGEKRYMGLAGCDGARMRCFCASELEELVGPSVQLAGFDDRDCVRVSGGCDNRRSHIEMAKWFHRLEPASREESYLLNDCGCKGVFEKGAADYFEDPLHKLVCPPTGDARSLGGTPVAIYEKVADL